VVLRAGCIGCAYDEDLEVKVTFRNLTLEHEVQQLRVQLSLAGACPWARRPVSQYSSLAN
jgi:hypothetical protein